MGTFALLNEDNVVVNIIKGRDEYEVVDGISNWEEHYSEATGLKAVRTSFNANFRNEYAEIGGVYDSTKDRFVSQSPHPSWILDSETGKWKAPVAEPWTTPEERILWFWDEPTVSWVYSYVLARLST